MVEPQFFFSTLAQASAAVVGFVVAVAAALYSLERQHVERLTDEYRDALTEFGNRYGFATEKLIKMLENEGGETTDEMMDLSNTRAELRELVNKENIDYPITSLFLCHINRIHVLLFQIRTQNDSALSAQELESLEESVRWLYDHFYQVDDVSKRFIEEATGKPYDEDDKLNEIRLFNSSFEVTGMLPHQLKRWFEEREKIESEVVRPQYDGPGGDEHDPLTGDNFWTLKILAEYLMSDFQKVRRKSKGTIIYYDPGIRPVVKISTYLILIGVFLPTAFLFDSPVALSQLTILTSEIALLGATLLLSITLVEIVLRSVEPSNQMGNIENLSNYSSLVVKLLPDLPY